MPAAQYPGGGGGVVVVERGGHAIDEAVEFAEDPAVELDRRWG